MSLRVRAADVIARAHEKTQEAKVRLGGSPRAKYPFHARLSISGEDYNALWDMSKEPTWQRDVARMYVPTLPQGWEVLIVSLRTRTMWGVQGALECCLATVKAKRADGKWEDTENIIPAMMIEPLNVDRLEEATRALKALMRKAR